jgi:DNA polymerase III subunit gamma/tau
MDDVSLYRKHRPHDFDNLIGQDHVRQTLTNALKSQHVAHAYLFTGPRGTGKTSTARLIAKSLNCENLKDAYEPCNECDFCKDISSGRLIDLIEIDAASNRGIDEVRDLKEKINFAPSRAKYKIYIIDEVHMMTKEAFNALLKTLEEPPSHAYFILATTEVHKIPDTIISRCQRFDFRRIGLADVVGRLKVVAEKEGFEVEEKALEAIGHYVDGGMRDAIGLLEQLVVDGKLSFDNVQKVLGLSDHNLLEKLYGAVTVEDAQVALQIIHELHDHGSDLKQFTHEFLDLLRVKMLESVGKKDEVLTGRLIDVIEIFEGAQKRSGLSIPQLPLEIAVIKVCGALKEGFVYEKKAEVEPKVEEPKAVKVVAPEVVEPKAVAEIKPVPEVEVSAPVETVKVEATEVEEPEKTENVNLGVGVQLALEDISKSWPRVTERISTPSLRMSLKDCKPIEVKEADLTVAFNTNFHMNKVMEHDHRVELEESMTEVFGRSYKLTAKVRELEIKPMVDVRQAQNSTLDDLDAPVAKQAVPEPPAQDQVSEVMDIFGGELVE